MTGAEIYTMVLETLTAIGTVGAVIISLYYSYKAQKKEHKFLEFVGVYGYTTTASSVLYLTLDNFSDKDIVCKSLWKAPSPYDRLVGYNVIDKIPSYARNALIEFGSRSRTQDSIIKTWTTPQILLRLDTDCGSFSFELNKKQLKKFKKGLQQ